MFTRKSIKLPTLPSAIPETVTSDNWRAEVEQLRHQVNALRQTHYDSMRAVDDFLKALNNRGTLGAVTPWTPTITFATPGDLAVVYSTRIGRVVEFGPLKLILFHIVTSTFTHTTATGAVSITGNPVTNRALTQASGSMTWQGITKANYTQMNPAISSGATAISVIGMGSGQPGNSIGTGDMPTGGTVAFIGGVAILA